MRHGNTRGTRPITQRAPCPTLATKMQGPDDQRAIRMEFDAAVEARIRSCMSSILGTPSADDHAAMLALNIVVSVTNRIVMRRRCIRTFRWRMTQPHGRVNESSRRSVAFEAIARMLYRAWPRLRANSGALLS